jgi:transcriptional regulator with XRE-family HTH domain
VSSNRTRSELQRLKRQLKKAGLLANLAKVSPASISRILSGKSRPSAATVFKLAASLDNHAGARLVAAYLSDEIPETLRPYIRVRVRNDGEENWPVEIDRLWQKINLLKPDVRSLVESVVDQLLNPQDPNSPVIYMDGKVLHR